MNPYDVKMTPTVGGGLPGLPRRETRPMQKILSPVAAALRRFVEPCGPRYPVTSCIKEWASYFGVYPCRDTPGVGLMVRYDAGRASGKYDYIGFRYGTSGITLGEPLVNSQTTSAMRMPAVLPGGRYIYNRYSSLDFYLVTLNPVTLDLMESKLCTAPSSGTLETGENYTVSNVWDAAGENAWSCKKVFMSDHDTFLFFEGVTVDGVLWIAAFEYGMGGDLVAVRRVFAPDMGGISPTLQLLAAQKTGSWYYLLFNCRNSNSGRFSCYAVQEGMGQVLKLRESAGSTQYFVPRIFGDDRSIMLVALTRSDEVSENNSWILELDAAGSPTSAGAATGKLGKTFMGDAALDVSLMEKIHDPMTGLYVSRNGVAGTLGVDYGRKHGMFHTLPDEKAAIADSPSGFVYRYATQKKTDGKLLVTIDDAVIPTCPFVQRLDLLENGLWFGILSDGKASPTYFYQMFQEV